eukprot:TRINITY_DN27679_c0_g3_i1.p1 TRINITY_DN27679_c0_g3~~TRINITY_DN27679_c0_g3_i1.p1  ORF type:complete len:183 (-),score=10.54 TRINITY_DN27679_c0_g3_i1:24-572(-)
MASGLGMRSPPAGPGVPNHSPSRGSLSEVPMACGSMRIRSGGKLSDVRRGFSSAALPSGGGLHVACANSVGSRHAGSQRDSRSQSAQSRDWTTVTRGSSPSEAPRDCRRAQGSAEYRFRNDFEKADHHVPSLGFKPLAAGNPVVHWNSPPPNHGLSRGRGAISARSTLPGSMQLGIPRDNNA